MIEGTLSLIPASLADKYLPAQQFVRIIHVSSASVYGWCNVEDLPRVIPGNNINDFWVTPLDAE